MIYTVPYSICPSSSVPIFFPSRTRSKTSFHSNCVRKGMERGSDYGEKGRVGLGAGYFIE